MMAQRRIIKLAQVFFVILAFVLFTAIPTTATSITPSPQQNNEDWLLAVIAAISAAAAIGSLIVNIINSPSKPPAAEADVTLQADQNSGGDHGSTRAIGAPAEAVKFVQGNKGSTAFGDLTITNQGGGRWTGTTDTSTGRAAAGGNSSGTLTGSVDGRIVLQSPLPMALVPQISRQQLEQLATLTFTPAFSIGTLNLNAGAGNQLSADLDLAVSPTSSQRYHWGFTAINGAGGGLQILDRRGLFSDTDLTLSGNQILGIRAPAANFVVPLDEPLDYSGSLVFSASESLPEIPEPASWLLLASGLIGLAALNRTQWLPRS